MRVFVAQLDRALPSEGKGCAFKSHRGRFGRFGSEVDDEFQKTSQFVQCLFADRFGIRIVRVQILTL